MRTIKTTIKQKKAGFTDLFLIIIFGLIIVVALGIFVYIGAITNSKMHEVFDNRMFGDVNSTEAITESMGAVDNSYQSLYWIAFFLIMGMVISSIMGAYLVTTHPMFLIPYIFIVIIATIMSAGISNAYEMLATDDLLASTYSKFTMANIFMSYMPLWIAAIGIIGGVVMLSRMGSGQQQTQYYV